MMLGPEWIARDELIAELRQLGIHVSRHQLLRWHDAGLLPQPRRWGHGRGKDGSTSYYPWYALPQAAELASRLKGKRSLPEAGWALWVLGFPVTPFARGLLLNDLEDFERTLQKASRPRGRRRASTYFDHVATEPGTTLTKRMAKAVRREHLPKVFRIIAEMELGTLDPDDYAESDWELVQDAVLAGVFPDHIDDPDLPSASEVSAGLSRLAKTQNLPAVTRALANVDDRALRKFRNEAQALFAQMANALGLGDVLIPPDAFLRYFKVRYVDKEAAKETVRLLKALGWSRPPPSPLVHVLRQARDRVSA